MALALLLTFLAGSATALGGLVGVLLPKGSMRVLSAAMALAAGVMIYISLFELLPTALVAAQPPILAVLGFLAGGFLVVLLSKLADRRAAVAHRHTREDVSMLGTDVPIETGEPPDHRRLARTGLTMAIVLAAHNAPEGFVTLISTLQDPVVAIPIVFAIALHNIPEGIAVAVPMYQATGKRFRSWALSAASGMAEPVGAVALFVIVGPLLDGTTIGVVNATLAGIMVFISLHELIPLALKSGRRSTVVLWLLAGMAIMAASLFALR